MSGEILDAIQRDNALGADALGRVVRGFEAAIARSFEQDKSRMTASEVRRRFDICARWFRQLRSEHQWSSTRALDTLPRILRLELDGGSFDPAKERSVWVPQDGLG